MPAVYTSMSQVPEDQESGFMIVPLTQGANYDYDVAASQHMGSVTDRPMSSAGVPDGDGSLGCAHGDVADYPRGDVAFEESDSDDVEIVGETGGGAADVAPESEVGQVEGGEPAADQEATEANAMKDTLEQVQICIAAWKTFVPESRYTMPVHSDIDNLAMAATIALSALEQNSVEDTGPTMATFRSIMTDFEELKAGIDNMEL